MNAQTYISIDGKTIEQPTDLPDRKFRDAWALNADGTITLDPVKKSTITKKLFQAAIEQHIEAVAAERGYSSGASCAGYANSTIAAWADEAAAFIAWRDSVWSYAFTEMDKVVAGTRPEPTIEKLISELPKIAW